MLTHLSAISFILDAVRESEGGHIPARRLTPNSQESVSQSIFFLAAISPTASDKNSQESVSQSISYIKPPCTGLAHVSLFRDTCAKAYAFIHTHV